MAKKATPPAPASANGRPGFDPDALRALSGDASFRRGEEYFRDGAVTLLSVEPARVLASVAGTDFMKLLPAKERKTGFTSCVLRGPRKSAGTSG